MNKHYVCSGTMYSYKKTNVFILKWIFTLALISNLWLTMQLLSSQAFNGDGSHDVYEKPLRPITDANIVGKRKGNDYAQAKDITPIYATRVDCKALFENHSHINLDNFATMNLPSWNLPDQHIIKRIKQCSTYQKTNTYIMKPVSGEEANFPLAFSILVYRSAHQVEQLLQAIYRPQNYYCLHVDIKATPTFYQAMSKIAGCFNNVFLSSKRHDVHWGCYSVLQAELQCMRDLWNKTHWKYYINLTGQEFPLKTNLDIVRILKIYNGSNAIDFDLWKNKRRAYRTDFIYLYPPQGDRRKEALPDMMDTSQGCVHPTDFRCRYPLKMGPRKEPAPHNLKLTTGAVHVALTRGFVNYVLHNQVAVDFLDWLIDTHIPDESYFASLQINPQLGVPGAFTGNANEPSKYHEPYTRFKKWTKCKRYGLRVHTVCILGVYYMADLASAPEMFANKFHPDFQPVARMCLQELLRNRTIEQLSGRELLNPWIYENRTFVKQHLPS